MYAFGGFPNMAKLGVNIDHVATVRQARRTYEPVTCKRSGLAELGGAGLAELSEGV